jgi:antirestriction protein
MQIWVGSLADYNAGRLHGVWINLAGKDVSSVREEIDAMLAASAEPYAEEWIVMDYDDAPGALGETSDLDMLVAVQQAVEEHGETPVRAALANYYRTEEALDALANGFMVWDDSDQIVESYLEGYMIPDQLRYYIDHDAIWRDLRMDGTYVEADDGSIIEFFN